MGSTISKPLGCAVLLAASLCLTGNAWADTINVTVWSGAATYSGSNVCSNGGGTSCGTPDSFNPSTPASYLSTFSGTVSGTDPIFSFSTNTDTSLSGFLQAGGDTYSGTDQTSGGTVASGDTATVGMNNDIMDFTGSAYLSNGETYNFTHDDGMYLYVDGNLEISSGTPVADGHDTFTWSGASGIYNFNLWYEEINGEPGELQSPDFGVAPEPSTLLLLGTGFFMLAFLLFRKSAKPSGGALLVRI